MDESGNSDGGIVVIIGAIFIVVIFFFKVLPMFDQTVEKTYGPTPVAVDYTLLGWGLLIALIALLVVMIIGLARS